MYAGTFDSEGATELQNAGKAGLVTVQGKISAVLGTVLICKFIISIANFNMLCFEGRLVVVALTFFLFGPHLQVRFFLSHFSRNRRKRYFK